MRKHIIFEVVFFMLALSIANCDRWAVLISGKNNFLFFKSNKI